MAAFIAPAVGLATSIIGGITGSSAAKKASEIEQRFGTLNAQGVTQAGQVNSQRMSDQYKAAQDRYSAEDPYTTAGASGVNQLSDLLNPNGGALTQAIPLNLPAALTGTGTNVTGTNLGQFNFDPSKIADDPNYKFTLDQGEQALQRLYSKAGGLSGGQLKALDQYSQGTASTFEQQIHDRELADYNANNNATLQNWQTGDTATQQNWQTGNTANLQNWQTGVQNALNTFNATNTNRQNLYSQLMGLTNLGANMTQNQTNNLSGLDMNYANAKNQTEWNTATTAAGLWDQVANAQAGGVMGANNAWQSALGGINKAVTGGLSSMQLQQLLGMSGSGGGSDLGLGDLSSIPGGQSMGSMYPQPSTNFLDPSSVASYGSGAFSGSGFGG